MSVVEEQEEERENNEDEMLNDDTWAGLETNEKGKLYIMTTKAKEPSMCFVY